MQISVTKNVEKIISSLDDKTIAKVLRTVDLLEQFGNRLGLPHSKKIDRGLFELRVRGKREVRIFYVFKRNHAILIHGFVKKSQKAPQKELRLAKQKMRLV